MKFKGLDGRNYSVDLTRYEMDPDRPCSSGHIRARKVLASLYPCERVLEEVSIPGCDGALRCDFFVPLRQLVIEVQGDQHREFTPFFHYGDVLNFFRSQSRDRKKRHFCELNNLHLVELWYDKSDDQWAKTIRLAVAGQLELPT